MSRLAALALVSALVLSACSGGEDEPSVEPTPSDSAQPSPSPEKSEAASPTQKPEEEASGRPKKIGATFFGMHDGRITQGITPDAPVGALRLWDSETSWLHLETSPGQFSWTALDTAVATAEAANARPLLVLGQTPAFHATRPNEEAAYGPGAASMPDVGAWRRYVTAVAERYGDRIDYQVWNETNVTDYWSGTPKQMAQLTVQASRAIRRAVPRATVVAPAFVLRLGSTQRYFAEYWAWQSRGIDLESAVDVVSVQLYPPAEGPPEGQVEFLDIARDVLTDEGVDLPVWNTEINFGLQGGPPPPAIPEERQRAFLMRTYLLNAGLGVERVYWYRWDLQPIANTFLSTPDYSAPTLAGRAFPTVRNWLEGTVVEGCEVFEGIWTCTARAGNETRTFAWKPRGPATRFPAGEEARSWTNADGDVTRCRASCQVPVGETPVMVTSR